MFPKVSLVNSVENLAKMINLIAVPKVPGKLTGILMKRSPHYL